LDFIMAKECAATLRRKFPGRKSRFGESAIVLARAGLYAAATKPMRLRALVLNELPKMAVLLALGIFGCLEIAASAGVPPACQSYDLPLPVNLYRNAVLSKFGAVKMVANASIETLIKEENESGVVPKADWMRLQDYLAKFQARYPEFQSARLDSFLALAESKSR
jgi:hypothetical protein